jgi:hypothetical protein
MYRGEIREIRKSGDRRDVVGLAEGAKPRATSMGVLERVVQRVGTGRNSDQVDVIRYQAVARYGHTMELAVLIQQPQVGGAASVALENGLPGVASLGNVVRNVGSDDTSQTGHPRWSGKRR